MKKLLIIPLMLLYISSFAGIDSTIKATADSASVLTGKLVNDSTKLTWLKVYEDTKEGIASLGKALKIPAEHVYGVLVKQQVVNAVVWLIILIGVIVGIHYYTKWVRWELKDGDANINTGRGMPLTVVGIVCVVLIVVCILHIDVVTTGFINPEYGAIQDIWNFVKH